MYRGLFLLMSPHPPHTPHCFNTVAPGSSHKPVSYLSIIWNMNKRSGNVRNEESVLITHNTLHTQMSVVIMPPSYTITSHLLHVFRNIIALNILLGSLFKIIGIYNLTWNLQSRKCPDIQIMSKWRDCLFFRQSSSSINLISNLYYSNLIPYLNGTSGHPMIINNYRDWDWFECFFSYFQSHAVSQLKLQALCKCSGGIFLFWKMDDMKF